MSFTRYSAALAAMLTTLPALAYAQDATEVVVDETVIEEITPETTGAMIQAQFQVQTQAQVQAQEQERTRANIQEKDQVMAEGDAVQTQAKEEKGFLERVFGLTPDKGSSNGSGGSDSDGGNGDGGNGGGNGGGSGGGNGGGSGGGNGGGGNGR